MLLKCSLSRRVLLAATLLPACCSVLAATAPTLSVNANESKRWISPHIYGIANGVDAAFAEEIKLPNVRWGGDGASRYNWDVDSSSAGGDWYFVGGNGQSHPVRGFSVDSMLKTYKPAETRGLVTIPIIPYVNKSSEWNCSFPTSVYGAQQSTDPYLHPNGESCGNGVSKKGKVLKDKDPDSNNTVNTTSLQKGWVDHLVAEFGTAAKGGVKFYQLDNEPSGWSNTQRDIEPDTPTYSTLVALGQQYAAAIKEEDSSALILGPSDFTLGGWVGNPGQQNNLLAGQFYLQQMAAYQKAHGQRLLDYFDEHYYPQFTDAATQLASTRTLWDPTYNGGTWVEKYIFDGPMQLIPRFQGWVNKYYPGTKVSLSEYSIDSGHKLITDALAEADVLGIFGREGLALANMWVPPAPTDPIAYSFRLYRNYDGKGGQFGQLGVQAASTNQADVSIYAAKRSADGALTVIVLNKTTTAIDTTLTLSNFAGAGSAAVYRYSKSNLKEIQTLGNVSLQKDTLTYSYPAYSATVLVVAEAKE